ncbi:hypothetical protein [uncultured Sphaerochaeta sp.]|uniref:hypothetical protein n=1 Tax=uncultured Sphaerochaeta sp. TaxID=886478 RepID=UPI002A0A40B1|nr:hypothetical protein [uncultured Sphaerochaeta sp.]
MNQIEHAYALLNEWKGTSYIHGLGVLDQVGTLAAKYGKTALVVSNGTYLKPVADQVVASLKATGITLAGGTIAPDAKPNAPREEMSIDSNPICYIQNQIALLPSEVVLPLMPARQRMSLPP